MNVGVFVLGELGRSPRMQYHTLSLASCGQSMPDTPRPAGGSGRGGSLDHTGASTASESAHAPFEVHCFGLSGATVHPLVSSKQNIHLHLFDDAMWTWLPPRTHPLFQWSVFSAWLWYLVIAPLKVLLQCAVILAHLLWHLPNDTRYLLVQNPPSIPTLILAQLVCLLFKRQCRLVVDWHNFGFSLLDVKNANETKWMERNHRRERMVVRLARYIEITFGRRAYHHFCVSDAMRDMLLARWGIRATVLYDRPPEMFKELSLQEKHNLYVRVFGEEAHQVRDDDTITSTTLFTTCRRLMEGGESNVVELREDRPALIVSSTSWTPDEDFQILLDAIQMLERMLVDRDMLDSFPRLEFVITGRGPQKAVYERKIASMNLRKCRIRTAWLRAEDYPMLLASSDLGVCLHFSSSGVDLPMKIVDMFGSGLPVCAIGYKTLPELVQHDKNGYIFDDYGQLAKQFLSLFQTFPQDTSGTMNRFREHLRQHFQTHRWNDEWEQKARPVFTDNASSQRKKNQ